MKNNKYQYILINFYKFSNFCIHLKTILFSFLFLPFIFSGCKKFVEVDPPKTGLISEIVFSSDATATAAISSVYARMAGSFLGAGSASLIVLNGFTSDELIPANTANESFRQFYNNNLSSTNTFISSIWSEGYNIIYQCNAILKGLGGSKGVSTLIQKQIEGEALFLRAYTHFHLTNLFGDIPYVINTDYLENSQVSRQEKSHVLNNVIQDLIKAKEQLTDDYSFSKYERVRVNKWVATALLARVYLFKEDWHNAIQEATEVINHTALFELVPDLNNVFLKESPEAIWQWMPGNADQNSTEGTYFILTGPPNIASLTAELIDHFEPGDRRFEHWIGSFTNGITTWYFPFKYKLKEPTASSQEYSVVMRLAELYLIRAEAKAMQNQLAEAIADLDIIRERAGIPLIADSNPSIEKSQLLIAIEHERFSELFTENHRWYDLNRTSRSESILGALKPTWQSTDKLFPLPESELLINPMLKPQNPGY